MKKRTQKELFLEIIQKMNTYFEEKISIKDATEVYDYEISPYGYPSHQKFILGQAMVSHAFNQNIMDGKYKGYKNAPTVGEGFSHNLTPNYYITDSLAQVLKEAEFFLLSEPKVFNAWFRKNISKKMYKIEEEK